MTITTQDIQLYQSEVLNETDQGGGRMSGTQVVDGELNNLFDDQSRLDRVTGRVSLRKAFMAVLSQNTTKLLGAHAILLQRALDPAVHVTMYGRDSHVDRRSDAQQHLEQYLAAGATLPLFAYDTQPEGALQVVFYTHPENSIPVAGDTLVLSVERGSVNLGQQQFVRVVKISSEIVVVTVQTNATIRTRLVYVEIDQPLRFDVPGEELRHVFQEPRTVIRRTTLAAGKRYYGVHKITEAAAIGQTSVNLDTILTPVVPSAQQQQGITDQQIGSDRTQIVPLRALDDALGEFVETMNGITPLNNAVNYITLRAITPGAGATVVVQTGGSATRAVLVDNGDGTMDRDPSSGASVPLDCSGTIDYQNGGVSVVNLADNGVTTASSITYRPAAPIVDVQHTDGVLIDLNNRALVYVRTLVPRPLPGSVQIEYRALGRWITLTDRGDGTIRGQPGDGSGTINYATGTVNITLGIEPDLGSHVLYGWGSGVHYRGPTEDIEVETPQLNFNLAAESGFADAIIPGTFSLSFTADMVAYTATDDGAGNITGDATGTIEYISTEVRIRLTTVPPPGTEIQFDYQRQVPSTEAPPAFTIEPSTYDVTLAATDITPFGFRALISATRAGALGTMAIQLQDDGAGGLVTVAQRFERYDFGSPGLVVGSVLVLPTRGFIPGGISAGTINYATGAVTINRTIANAVGEGLYDYAMSVPSSPWDVTYYDATLAGLTNVRYMNGVAAGTATGVAPSIDELSFFIEGDDLLGGIMPGSLLFTFAGSTYVDRAGVLYTRDSNGIDVVSGNVDYTAGLIRISTWVTGPSTTVMRGILVTYGRWGVTRSFWRVNAQQILPSSYQLTYLRDGQELPDQASADNAGDIVGPDLVGTIDTQTGVYDLTFANPVLPETARYNAVSVSFLPLDPAIIGLDPVRLSADGRVPTVQNADVAVIHNTVDTVLDNPVIAGQTYETRPSISDLELRDANNLIVPTDRYTWSKVSGQLTFANPLDLDDYEQPLTARHRIEDMLLVTDAQLNGLVGLNSALTHDFPAETSFLSTALILDQELQATAFNVFSQTSWTGVWSDTLIGSSPTGQYNTVVAPFQMTNRGSIRERWRIEFTSVTAFRLIGETVGQVGVGDVNTDFAPINPTTGDPYVTILAAGWSAGWNVGNQVRFNTEGAQAPIWLNRTTLPGPLTDPVDRVQIALRGDAN